MGRTENDTWDLASSVGATATMVTAARAVAGRAAEPLIHDEYAEPLVRAVGVDVFTRIAGGELGPEDVGGLQRMADNIACRTVFFDDFFTDAARSGITQAVILAAGLDSRAYRLAWPAGTTVYEIDQPDVVEFKSRTMAELGAEPRAERHAVAVDLRFDWPAALTAAGFDPGTPTAWSAEGLLGYLPPDAQDRLLDTITGLSAPDSRIATESAPAPDPADAEALQEKMREVSDRWRDLGVDIDFAELIYSGDRNEAAAYLTERGWHVHGRTMRELYLSHGLEPVEETPGGFADMQYVVGILANDGSDA